MKHIYTVFLDQEMFDANETHVIKIVPKTTSNYIITCGKGEADSGELKFLVNIKGGKSYKIPVKIERTYKTELTFDD